MDSITLEAGKEYFLGRKAELEREIQDINEKLDFIENELLGGS